MLTPRPWQLEGAEFLARPLCRTAGLFDDPRVGKTGATLLACNMINADSVAVVTKRSGVPVWQRDFDQWRLRAEHRRIVSWGGDIAALSRDEWDVLIVDESHKAANPDSTRTKAVYGELGPDGLWDRSRAAVARATRVWCLSGTPAPHDNGNWWPMIRSLAPELLERNSFEAEIAGGAYFPKVRSWPAFRERYCQIGYKKVAYGEPIPVVVGGRNSEELRDRLSGWFLRRTQAEVGIAEPTYDLLPLAPGATKTVAVPDVDRERVLAAADAGDTDALEMLLAKLMRLTGEIKAEAIKPFVMDELDAGAGKIVLAYWHRSVGDLLQMIFAQRGVLRLDGAVAPQNRGPLEQRWRDGPEEIFLNQMEAGGEAIDLSPADQMIIVEPTFRPATMRQVAQRIVNINKRTTPLVRVAVLAGSIDEAVQERLLALWAPIKTVLA